MNQETISSWYNNFYTRKEVNKKLSPWRRTTFQLICELGLKGKILDVGCGDGGLLFELIKSSMFGKEDIYGIDISKSAINISRARLGIPEEHLKTYDIESSELPFRQEFFDIVVMNDVIEHLQHPFKSLPKTLKMLKVKGHLVISFPNYTNLPWLALRILAEKLKRPGWIVLQPVDHIFFYRGLKDLLVKRFGLKFITSRGSVFFPPLLYKFEPRIFSLVLNKLGLAFLSFHPVLVFKKNEK